MVKKFIFISLALVYLFSDVNATHIRAGEIIAKRISSTSLTYEFTIIGYTDTGSEVEFGGGKFDFGDGNIVEVLDESAISANKIQLENQVALNLFKVIHTFQAPGRYVVSYYEQNRNDQIVNMENSVDTPFFIETEILIDPLFGLNNTPVLLIPPIDNGIVGIRYIHNPGAYDPDGDSLSYELVIPMQDNVFEVTNYRFPNFEEFYYEYNEGTEDGLGQPTFTLDSILGDLIWDAPGSQGEYNFAFRVIEWRKVGSEWFKLGHVTRDMQVFIQTSNNERPILESLDPICVDAGTLIQDTIFGEDPDFNKVKIEAFGGPFEFISSPATFSPNPPQFKDSPSTMLFEWQTNCSHVRERPYDIQFKITDQPNYGPNLVEFSNWQVQVVAPAPTGLNVTLLPGRSALVSWDQYSCDNADEIQIWRRIGNFEYDPDNCEIGIPEGSGYKLIGSVEGNEVIYDDNNGGSKLAPGSKYCYRLVAKFKLPEGGTSYVSEEVCVIIEADAPVVTNVSVEKTDILDGENFISWIPPLELDTFLFPKPYNYKVKRYDDYSSKDLLFESSIIPDTFFVDNLINTDENIFNYKIEVFSSADTIPFDTSSHASSVRLELNSTQNTINLNWNFDVPWSNSSSSYPMHYIYRNNVSGYLGDDFILIDSVNVIDSGYNYSDDGGFEGIPLDDDKFYCYYVITSGTYENSVLPLDISHGDNLLNKSQKICAQTNDLVPPCPPVNFKISDDYICENYFSNKSCSIKDFENRIEWEIENDPCSFDSKFYNIYFSEDKNRFKKIGTVSNTYFEHKNLTNLKGYYYVTSLDRSGNESVPSDTISRDNCPVYILPNVFTPNGDGNNDFFTPFYSDGSIIGFDFSRCPRFVRSVNISIVDRAGNQVFTYDSDKDLDNGIFINWNGKTKGGKDLPSGTYFYNANVRFDVLDESNQIKEIKGWVQLLR